VLSSGSPYRICPSFGELTAEDIEIDTERFFTKYTVDKGIDGIEPEDIDKVFILYMSQYLIHKDSLASEKLN